MLNILVKVSLAPIQDSSAVWEEGGGGLTREEGLSSISAPRVASGTLGLMALLAAQLLSAPESI